MHNTAGMWYNEICVAQLALYEKSLRVNVGADGIGATHRLKFRCQRQRIESGGMEAGSAAASRDDVEGTSPDPIARVGGDGLFHGGAWGRAGKSIKSQRADAFTQTVPPVWPLQ